jgi:hypothetical protein
MDQFTDHDQLLDPIDSLSFPSSIAEILDRPVKLPKNRYILIPNLRMPMPLQEQLQEVYSRSDRSFFI